MSEAVHLIFLVALLAGILVAPRRHGRPLGYLTKSGAVAMLVWGSIVVLLVLAWLYVLAWFLHRHVCAP